MVKSSHLVSSGESSVSKLTFTTTPSQVVGVALGVVLGSNVVGSALGKGVEGVVLG